MCQMLQIQMSSSLELTGFAAAQPHTGLSCLPLWAQCSPKLGTVPQASWHNLLMGTWGDVWSWSVTP